MIQTRHHAIHILILGLFTLTHSFLSLKTAFLRPSLILLYQVSEKATPEQVIEYAQQHGISLSVSSFGPAFRSTARSVQDSNLILGYCEGFLRPTGSIVQIEKLIVWKDALNKAKQMDPSSFQAHAGNTFGISLLVGHLALLHAYGQSRPLETVEFLAIDDEPYQHKRLVRFFQRAGFRVVRYVGDDWKDIPDRMIWGGCGTLMDATIDHLLVKWTDLLFSKKTVPITNTII